MYYNNGQENELGFDAFIAPDDFDRTAQPVDIYEVFKYWYALNNQARYIYYYSDGNYPLTLTPTADEYYKYGHRNGGTDVVYDVPLTTNGGVATTIWGASGNTSGGDESGFTHRWVIVYRVSTAKFDVYTTTFRRCLWIYCGTYVDLVKLSEVDVYTSTEYYLKWIHYANINSIRGQFGSEYAYHNIFAKMQGRCILPETLNSIGSYMFAAQHNINKYNFPQTKNVSIIWAPENNRSLPYGVTEINFGASTTVNILSDTGSTYTISYSKIKQLSVSDQNTMYSSNSGCDIIFSKNGDAIICVAAETVRGIYLPDNLPQSELATIGDKITGIYTNLSANIMQGYPLYIGSQITDITNLYLSNKSFTTIAVGAGNTAFSVSGNMLFNAAQTSLIKAGTSNTGDLTIPNVQSIEADCFLRCTGYTGNLTIPSSVTSIAYGAFYGLTNLTTLTLPVGYDTAIYGYFGFANFTAVSLNTAIQNLASGTVGTPRTFYISKTSFDALNAAYPDAVSNAALRFINVIEGIVQDSSLKLWLDAGNTASYPGSGTVWNDLSGNGNNGTLVNGVAYSTANGGVMSFDGVDDRVQTAYNPTLGDFTVSLWFKSNSIIGYSRLMDKSYTNGIWLGRESNLPNRWGGGIRQTTSPYGLFITLQDNQWNNITMVRNGSTQLMYGNGVLMGSQACSNVALDTTTFAFGNWSGQNNTQRLTGNENDILIYNRALTADEININFQATRNKYGI